MGSVQGLLESTMKKLKEVSNSGGGRNLCYIIFFVVFVFIVLYFMISQKSTPTAPPS